MSTDVRRCWRCKRVLPVDRFSRDRCNGDQKHQRRYACGKCNTAMRDAWVDSLSPDRREAYLAQRRATNRRNPAYLERRSEERQRLHDDIETLVTMLDRLQAWGYSITDIARASGCTWDTISRWVRTRGDGVRTVQRQTIDKISRVYLREVQRVQGGV